MEYLLSAESASILVNSCDTFLLDMDGVLWQGDTLLPGVKETLSYLRQKGKTLVFVTNNSTKSRESYLQKLNKLGLDVEHQDVEKIFGSSFATAVYLSQVVKFPSEKKVYVVGQQGIIDELSRVGIQCCGGPEDKANISSDTEMESIVPDNIIGAVVCGFDIDINYKKYAKAYTYLSNNECLFIATNGDTTYPNNGRLFPGTGSLFTPLVASTKRNPVVLGKPHKIMLDCIMAKYNFSPDRTCMVGDRLDTDIVFGQSGGTKTLLVLTGVTSEDYLKSSKNKIIPDFVIDSLGSIGTIFNPA